MRSILLLAPCTLFTNCEFVTLDACHPNDFHSITPYNSRKYLFKYEHWNWIFFLTYSVKGNTVPSTFIAISYLIKFESDCVYIGNNGHKYQVW